MIDNTRIGAIGLRGFPYVMGGVERHCEQLYPRLAKLGFTVFVCRRKSYLSDESRRAEFNGIIFIDSWTPKYKHSEALFHSIISLISLKKLGLKILHIHSFGPGIIAPLAKLLGFKIVMTYHLPNYFQGKWSKLDRIVLRAIEYIACQFSDEIITVSKQNQSMIKKNTGRNSIVIPNGVNQPAIVKGDIAKYGLKKKKYIFAACRFVPEKGLDILIKAFGKIETDWKLVLAGAADHESKYSKDLLALAKANDNVILTGMVTGSDLEGLFSCAGLYVLLSFIEGQPISLLEAMSHGIPFIVSDIPAHRELDIEENCFVPPGDVEALAKKLQSCLKDSVFLSNGEKYKKAVLENYNWDSIALKTAEVFRNLY